MTYVTLIPVVAGVIIASGVCRSTAYCLLLTDARKWPISHSNHSVYCLASSQNQIASALLDFTFVGFFSCGIEQGLGNVSLLDNWIQCL